MINVRNKTLGGVILWENNQQVGDVMERSYHYVLKHIALIIYQTTIQQEFTNYFIYIYSSF